MARMAATLQFSHLISPKIKVVAMQWLADYWWIILLVLIGMVWNGMKALLKVDHKSFLSNKPELPPHRDNNAQWDNDDDWPKKK